MPLLDRKARALVAYGAGAGLSIVAAVILLDLTKADLRVPFGYGGDALLYSLIVKSTVDHAWFWTNFDLGAPAGFELYDFPASAHDSFHLLVIKVMSLFSGDWALLFNLYFLLGFPLITLSAMAVFRRFRVGYGPAMVGAILYAFLPSRLLKGEGHIFMDVFYEVPLAILVVLWVCSDRPPLVRDGAGGRRLGIDLLSGRSICALLICALTASTGLYYAFFVVCLLGAAGVWASFDRRTVRNAVAGLGLAGAVVVGLAANGLPTLVYQARHGANHLVGQRQTWEAEVFGMKMAQLLLPVAGHRIPALRELQAHYNSSAPLVGENGATALGTVGDVGFLWLLGAVLIGRRSENEPDAPLRPLAVLNLMAVLLGTIGGFGALIALLVSPEIRTYARINVLVGFFALFAVVLLLERLRERHPRWAPPVLGAVLVLGLLDQATPVAAQPYAETKRMYSSDADLVRRIEETVPRSTAIFQVPYQSFPEAPSVHGMESYDPIRPYLHSQTLRWSFPTMRGRSGDTWMSALSGRDPASLLKGIADAGFGGLLVDREGYADKGAAFEAQVRNALRVDPILGNKGRFAFFDLTDYRRLMDASRSPGEVARRQYLQMHPLGVSFGAGFSDVERGPNWTFRWCGATGEMRIDNDTTLVRRASVAMSLVAAHSPAHWRAEGDLFTESAVLAGVTHFSREFDVPPGSHVIRFTCDGKRADAPGDPRVLVWRLEGLVFEEVPAASASSR